MKNTVIILSVFTAFTISCGGKSEEIVQKELELREREIALKEKQLDLNSASKTEVESVTLTPEKIDNIENPVIEEVVKLIEKAKETEQIENTIEAPNDSPSSVMNTVFTAARTGEVGLLPFLLPPHGSGTTDGDCKALCYPGNEVMRKSLGHNYTTLSDFQKYFSKGKIVGDPIIMDNGAKVNFVFGPNLERSETMMMQQIEGKWYLASF